MKKEDAKREVLRRWLRLPAAERATKDGAHRFALRVVDEVQFRPEGDSSQQIMAWLDPYIGKG